jgi:hypothetical protein
MKPIKWTITSGSIRWEGISLTQFSAFDRIRSRPVEEFGMISLAENDRGESFPIRTSILMFRWYRDADAARFIAQMINEEGIPDTTRMDLHAAGR